MGLNDKQDVGKSIDIFSKLKEINSSQNLKPIEPTEAKAVTDISENINLLSRYQHLESLQPPTQSLNPPTSNLSISDSFHNPQAESPQAESPQTNLPQTNLPQTELSLPPSKQPETKIEKPWVLIPEAPELPKPPKFKPHKIASEIPVIPETNIPLPIPIPAKPLSTSLTQEEMDSLSMSLSEQSKDELVKTIHGLNIREVKIEIDTKCIRIVTNIVHKCKDMNIDWFIAIAGGEGVGKSTLALNVFALICQLVGFHPIDTLLRTLIYDEDELLKFISTVDPKEKFLPIDLDEGANILFNRESMQVKRTYILKFFNVMRFLNAIVIIPTPNIKFIDKNVKAHRLKSIFYIPQRGIYWFYDKDQVDRMLASETTKKWYWIEPRTVGTFGVNKGLETITTLIKENYVRMFSEKVKLFIQGQESGLKHKSTAGL